MSIAIQWGYTNANAETLPLTQGFIYFDAVTTFTKQLSGSVSKNPIDGGGNIADHFTRDNPIVNISAIISGVDISSKWKRIQDENGNTPTNIKQSVEPVRINSNSNPFVDLIPASLSQLFRPTSPTISLAAQSSETIVALQEQLEELFEDGKVQLVTLYEYLGNTLKRRPLENLVLTNIRFNINPESGSALFCELTLEQVRFSRIKKSQIPKSIRDTLVAEDLKRKAAETVNGGKADSTVQEDVPENLKKNKSKTTTELYDLFTLGE